MILFSSFIVVNGYNFGTQMTEVTAAGHVTLSTNKRFEGIFKLLWGNFFQILVNYYSILKQSVGLLMNLSAKCKVTPLLKEGKDVTVMIKLLALYTTYYYSFKIFPRF